MTSINTSIFRSYDIRGVYPSELNEDVAYLIGKAVVKRTSAKKVVVGRDMRLSGEALQDALVRGITDSGANVDKVGLVPVDFIYWAASAHGYDAGVEVTASHNPKEYGGFKMVDKAGFIRGVDLRELVEELASSPPMGGPSTSSGTNNVVPERSPDRIGTESKGVRSVDYWREYIAQLLKFVDVKKLRRLKIVVDAGNGMAGKVIPQLAAHLPILVVPMAFELDGNFPSRNPNPLAPGALDQLKARVVAEHADFGVAFDADTDRIFFVDEKGGFIQADTTLLMLAKYWIEREPGAGIAYNLINSKAVPEFISEWGGRPLRSAVGYVHMGRVMREGKGVMGGEVSAHYSFRDNYYYDSGYIALLIFLQVFCAQNKPLSEIVQQYTRYCRGDEVNFKVANARQVMAALGEKYHDAKIDKLDGITFEYPDWWFNVRPSNTEPLLRVTVEGNDCMIMEARRKEISGFIQNLS